MKIDVERLKVDAKYWDEVAPSWAKSLLGPCHHGRHYWFHQLVGTGGALCLETNNYRAVDTVQPHAWDVIPRPTTPPAPEWDGEEWPIPVGVTVNNWCGEPRTVIAHDKGNIICRCEESADSYTSYTKERATRIGLKPLRTKEQREREGLAEALSKAAYRMGFALDLEESDAFADAVLTWLKERNQ